MKIIYNNVFLLLNNEGNKQNEFSTKKEVVEFILHHIKNTLSFEDAEKLLHQLIMTDGPLVTKQETPALQLKEEIRTIREINNTRIFLKQIKKAEAENCTLPTITYEDDIPLILGKDFVREITEIGNGIITVVEKLVDTHHVTKEEAESLQEKIKETVGTSAALFLCEHAEIQN